MIGQKFQEQLKNLQLIEVHQTEAQTKRTCNKEKKKSNEIIKEKTNTKSPTQIQITPPKKRKSSTKQTPHRSSISKNHQRQAKKIVSQKARTKRKPESLIDQPRKTHLHFPNTLTVSLQRDNTPSTIVLDMILNNLMENLQ